MLKIFKPSGATAKLEAIERCQAVVSFSVDGRIIDANEHFLSLMGYSLQEVAGKQHSMFVDTLERESQVYAAFWESLRSGQVNSGEFKRMAKSGQEVWLRASYSPVLDQRGRPVQIVKAAYDVTAEKMMLAEASGQIEAISRSQAVVQFSLDGTILGANKHFLSTLGYSLEEIEGRSHRMFVEERHANSSDYRAFWAALGKGEYRAGEFKRLGKGGRQVWIQATYNPILDASGRPFKIIKYATDITAAKMRAADMSGQVEAVSRSQAVIQFDLNGIVLDANPNFLRAVGYELDEVKGQHHRMFVTPDYAESRAYSAFWTKLRAGEFSSAVFQRVGKGGRDVWIQASYNPVFDPDGRPYKVVKFATDVTHSMHVRTKAIEAAERTLTRVQAVSTASGEMHATSSNIADQMVQSQQAMDSIQERMLVAGDASSKLNRAADSMNGVVDAIQSIAEQINLLALNATIEAARAGSAGRGFSVVASEVKDLAGQAQAATGKISAEITAMQSVSREVTETLSSIRGAIDSIRNYIAQTTSASEQQRLTTGEVSSNVQVTATGVSEIARNLDEWLIGVEERRDSDRTRVALEGSIQIESLDPSQPAVTIPCMVLNMSESGAKLAVSAANLPPTFVLNVDGHEPQTCRVTRKSAGDVAVAFERRGVDAVQTKMRAHG